MPTRIVRDGINSSRAVNSLTEEAELFYRRLMSVVDDYGRMEDDAELIRAGCFPRQLERWPVARIARCLEQCNKVLMDDGTPLVRLYRVDSKQYLELAKFGQRERKSKYPAPPWSGPGGGSPPSAAVRREPRPKSESESESESESKSKAESNKNIPPADAGDEVSDPPDPRSEPAPPEPRPAAASVESVAVAVVERQKRAWFSQFWDGYWRKVGRESAHRIFNRRVKTERDWLQVQAAVAAQKPEMLAREPTFRPSPTSWLQQGRMFDEPTPPSNGNGNGSGPPPVSNEVRRREEENQIAKVLRRKIA